MRDDKINKIYTRGGDRGKTSLAGGTRVPKHDLRLEAYGNADELSAVTGMLLSQEGSALQHDVLIRILEHLMWVEAVLATPAGETKPVWDDEMKAGVNLLEQEIDRLNEGLPGLRHFILPGGHPTISWCHLARTVCRRTERAVSRLAEEHPQVNCVMAYLNRLSDYFFVLARWSAQQLGVAEIPWIPEAGK